MASIEKRIDSRGNATYRVKVRLKGHPAEIATFDSLTKAKKWASSTESAIREGRHFASSEAKRHTLAELIDRYTRDVLAAKKPKTRLHQQQQLKWWKDQLGAYSLDKITPAKIAEYRDKLSREPIPGPEGKEQRYRGPATVTRYLAALSHAFTIAMKEWGWVQDNPLRKVSKPKEPGGRVRFLSDDEVLPSGATVEGERTRLLRACREGPSPDLYTAVVLALSTGARKMEIMGLRWRQVDLNRGMIILEETKNGERRALPLVGHALELMKARAKVRRLDCDLVFPDPSDLERRKRDEAREVRPIDLRIPWEAALETAGIKDFRWHDLRHSAASYLAMSGASLAEIAEVLGHKTLAMVKRYSHLSDAHVARVVAKMNSRVFGG